MMDKCSWLILGLLSVIILLPPIIHGYIYPTGGDDSAHHLIVIQNIEINHPIPQYYLYSGQWMVGYPLVLVRDFLHIPVTVSFLWFNYVALIGLVLTNYFVFSRLSNKLTGLLVALVSFLLSANIALFQAGAIFNIINMGIILPWMIYFGITAYTRKSWKRLVPFVLIGVFFGFFHPTGIYLLTLPVIILIGWWQRKRLKSESIIALYVFGMMMIALLVVAFIFPKLSVDAGRQSVDATNLFWIILALGVEIFWQTRMKETQASSFIIIGVVLISSFLTLPGWFSYNSAIKPVDKQIIAYVNSLPETEFYGNEFVAPYIYQPYLNKIYQPRHSFYKDGLVYISRSVPLSAGVMLGTHYYYWDRQGKGFELDPPENMENIKYFDEGGIEAYVAETKP